LDKLELSSPPVPSPLDVLGSEKRAICSKWRERWLFSFEDCRLQRIHSPSDANDGLRKISLRELRFFSLKSAPWIAFMCVENSRSYRIANGPPCYRTISTGGTSPRALHQSSRLWKKKSLNWQSPYVHTYGWMSLKTCFLNSLVT